jgi:hypothetical protein
MDTARNGGRLLAADGGHDLKPMNEETVSEDGRTDHYLTEREGGATPSPSRTSDTIPLPPPHVVELVSWSRQRRHAIREQMHCDRTCDAFVTSLLGYHVGLPEAERKAIFKQAADFRLSVEKQLKARRKSEEKARGRLATARRTRDAPRLDGEGQDHCENLYGAALSVSLPIVLNSLRAREGWDQIRDTSEKAMREIARSFPVWDRAAQIVGFGDLGLAVIVAEAGNDLTAYPHHMHLWKRLGLAPYNGKAGSTWKAGGLNKKEWQDLGYNGVRRGSIAGDIGIPLFFMKSKNAYGAVYTARREHTALTHPDWSPAHSDNDARRIMTKALIKDIWRMWRECA